MLQSYKVKIRKLFIGGAFISKGMSERPWKLSVFLSRFKYIPVYIYKGSTMKKQKKQTTYPIKGVSFRGLCVWRTRVSDTI